MPRDHRNTIHLHDLIQPRDLEAVERDSIEPLAALDPAFPAQAARQAYWDAVALFHGERAGYHASDAWYHDLEHTCTVFLCTSALLQGAHFEGYQLSPHGQLLLLVAALYHDVGLIRRNGEESGTGARFTVGHETRSIAAMEEYTRQAGYSEQDRNDMRSMIQATALATRPDDIPFRDHETRTLAQLLGTSDLIGQMADRSYLEKLLLLYLEFQEAGIPGYSSELDLLEKTPGFYEGLVKQRLDIDLGRQHRLLRTFSRERWNLNHDPFESTIQSNLHYLHQLLQHGRDHYRRWLRRDGIVATLPQNP